MHTVQGAIPTDRRSAVCLPSGYLVDTFGRGSSDSAMQLARVAAGGQKLHLQVRSVHGRFSKLRRRFMQRCTLRTRCADIACQSAEYSTNEQSHDHHDASRQLQTVADGREDEIWRDSKSAKVII